MNQSVQVSGQLGKLFNTLREGQAPEKFTREYLKDIGFTSSNHHAFIPLLKGLKFLTADGTPTQRYKDFLDPTKWKKILAEAVREAYGDIFVIKSRPTKSDKKLIIGKYKSTYNLSTIAADRAASTFLALLELADADVLYDKTTHTTPLEPDEPPLEHPKEVPPPELPDAPPPQDRRPFGLHYNIQIHLPATKDIEVYNAIFKSIREHLIE